MDMFKDTFQILKLMWEEDAAVSHRAEENLMFHTHDQIFQSVDLIDN